MTGSSSMRHVVDFVKAFMREGETKELLKKGLEAALSTLMEVEVSALTGAEHGERSVERVASRNGYRERTLQTGLGSSVLRIPKLRSGCYFPSFLVGYKRSDDALLAAVATCYIEGVSTRNVGPVMQALGVEHMSKSQVSAICAGLDPMVKAFQSRDLGEYPYVWLDARYENVREDGRIHKVAVMVALGVRKDGVREVLGTAVERTEHETYWDRFLQSLVARGLRGVRLVITDAHSGLRRALERALPAARWQRCRVHFMRNLAGMLPKRKQPALLALAKSIFAVDSHAEALKARAEVAELFRRAGQADAARFIEETDEVLTYMEFPPEHWSKLHSTNFVERINRELKRRTRVVSIFPNRASLARLMGALMLEEHEEWLVGRRYISEASMGALYSPLEQLGLDTKPAQEVAA